MAAEAVGSSKDRSSIVIKDHETIREIRFSKIGNIQCGNTGKISLFFQTEEQLREFNSGKIEGLTELQPTCFARLRQEHELEMIFTCPHPYEKVDRAIQLVAKHYGIALS